MFCQSSALGNILFQSNLSHIPHQVARCIFCENKCFGRGVQNWLHNGCDAESTVIGSAIENGWTAENNTNLNDCAKGVNWKISASTVDPTGGATAKGASIAYASDKLTDGCSALTPKFIEIAPAKKSY